MSYIKMFTYTATAVAVFIAVFTFNTSSTEMAVSSESSYSVTALNTTTTTSIVYPADSYSSTDDISTLRKAARGNVHLVDDLVSLPPWLGPIPEYYGAGSGCSREEATIVANVLWYRGASDDTVEWMLKTMSRESTCDSSAHNGNRNTGDNSWGLCQANVLAGFFDSDGILAEYDYYRFAEDFTHNVEACAELWSVCGRGPWNYGDYYCSRPSS